MRAERSAGALRAWDRTDFVLNVYKEIPWTSHDAVGRIRRILGERRVGHAGSLDPFATGVLVIGVGRGTKLMSYLVDLPKAYRGTMLLGRRTDSGDMAGRLVEEGPVPAIDREGLQKLADQFLGRTMQIPPMVSAVKHEGRRLYDLARKGIAVEREARPIRIDRFTIVDVDLPRVDFEVECGRGTYVRTLVEDLAAKVQALATIESLTRTSVGGFHVADSVRIISPPGNAPDGLRSSAVSMSGALGHLPAAKVDGHWIRRLKQGMAPPWKWLEFDSQPRLDQTIRLLGREGELLAIATLDLLPGPADRPIDMAASVRLDRVF